MLQFSSERVYRQIRRTYFLTPLYFFVLILAGCSGPTLKPSPAPIPSTPTPPSESRQEPGAACPPVISPTIVAPESPVAPGNLVSADWSALPNWEREDLASTWNAFLASCSALKTQITWSALCSKAAELPPSDNNILRDFFRSNFSLYQVKNADTTDEGLITGYYEPLLRGSRNRSSRYRYPVYGVPNDLLVIDLGDVYPELKHMRLRGRLDGQKVRPYFTRADIENGSAGLTGNEIFWVEDAVELFFLQIQGSGKIILEDGETVRIGYAEQNGHPFRSIGRLLVQRGELPLEKASLEGIRHWAKRNPDKLTELLNFNASYVFFRELPSDLPGPLGSLGVPLTAGRSLAVDTRVIPAGAPVYITTTWPNSQRPLSRLMMAQDTGGAIKGGVRADFFWGFGDEAAKFAGKMRQTGKLWVLLPRGQRVN